MSSTSGMSIPRSAQHPVYEPLEPGRLTIRVLELEPSADFGAEIQCGLKKFNFFDPATGPNLQSFEALSYTWGDVTALREIIVNDMPFKVTANLESFLRHRREVKVAVVIWIDAICINQNDLLEKNFQIPMMNMIYMAASKVRVWLGDASDDSHIAMKRIVSLGCGSPYDKMPNLSNDIIVALQRLLARPWWTRIWIVQELVSGGMTRKLDKVKVQCGKDIVLWINFVVAAARMKAYQDDLRQSFPNVTNILELDSLRDSIGYLWIDPPSKEITFDLMCRYRHFLATDPRDKIYAISSIFSRGFSQSMVAKYQAPVETIYLEFAVQMVSKDHDLEFLRHCGVAKFDLPSWVPDWSIPLGSEPLPLRVPRRYFDVPWWAEPIPQGTSSPSSSDGSRDPSQVQYHVYGYPKNQVEAGRIRELRMKRLQLAAKGFGIVKDLEEIPLGFGLRDAPEEMKNELRELLQQKNLILGVSDERCENTSLKGTIQKQADALEQGEILTERRMKEWIVREIKGPSSDSSYRCAGSTGPNFKINESRKALDVQGVLWDTVDVCHDSFVRDINLDWKDTTRFMVSIGCCKALAVTNESAAKRYPEVDELLKAFWTTLFVGQDITPKSNTADKSTQAKRSYSNWLPEIPKSWVAEKPLVTAKTTGVVEFAQVSAAMKQVYDQLKRGGSKEPNYKISSTMKFDGYVPQEWTQREIESHQRDIDELGAMWGEQPYDIYHRPFSLLNVVPDPYWRTRKEMDILAQEMTRENIPRPIMTLLPKMAENLDDSTNPGKDLHQLSAEVHETLKQKPSIIPQGTLEPGFEKYALGRRFFITKKGYMGLVPADMAAGDRIVVLFGSGVPFLLRKSTGIAGTRGWRVVGESYINGIMDGEVIEKWEAGFVETGMITLC